MGYSKNLAIEKGYFDDPENDSYGLDDFLCQIQVEELPYRKGVQPESNNDLVELIPF